MKKAIEDHRLLRCFAFDDLLHRSYNSPVWLENPDIANLVSQALLYRNGPVYKLYTYCLMPNHVHMVFTVGRVDNSTNNNYLTYIANIFHSLKRYTANKANKFLNRSGAFWQHESYDHVIRSQDEYDRIVNYVRQNPVKAGLVKDWKDWEWSM